jgi:hypothetical protein
MTTDNVGTDAFLTALMKLRGDPAWAELPPHVHAQVESLLLPRVDAVTRANEMSRLLRETPALVQLWRAVMAGDSASDGAERQEWLGSQRTGPPLLRWECAVTGCGVRDYGDVYGPYRLHQCPDHRRALRRVDDAG